ncbi:MAG: hypothetical protein ACTSRW_05105 [Candidatus Helarchaeota archaeon]
MARQTDVNLLSSPLDHDFILTLENYFFTVVGYQHPPDRIFAYLKYVPAPEGKWRVDKQPLERVLPHYSAAMVHETFQILEKQHPEYIFDCPINNITMTAVPKSSIKEYFKPQQAISKLKQESKLDLLQRKTLDLIDVLTDMGGIQHKSFGVTGSILLDIHDPSFSDIDLTIHGHSNSMIIKDVVTNLYEADSRFARMSIQEASEWKARKVKQFNLTSENVEILYRRKWNMGYFTNTKFSVHPIHLEKEIKDSYGSKRFIPKGEITIKACIVDDQEAMYIPCIYEIDEVHVIEGKKVKNIREIISFEGLYCSVGKVGEKITCRGKLEEVIVPEHDNYYRIVLGSFSTTQDFFHPQE